MQPAVKADVAVMRLKLLRPRSLITSPILWSAVLLISTLIWFIGVDVEMELNVAVPIVFSGSCVKSVVENAVIERFIWSDQLQDWTLSRSDEADVQPGHMPVWPETDRNKQDRIINQLRLVTQIEKKFKILPPDFNYPQGPATFDSCPSNRCEITQDPQEAGALIFQNSDVPDHVAKLPRHPEQVWIAYLLESPVHTFDPKFKRRNRGQHPFNWTATYRSDSDIVTPYSKFVVFADEVNNVIKLKSDQFDRQSIDASYQAATASHKSLISQKGPKVAWFVSNCNAANSRLEYARELSQYIQVDIFGRCGNLTCDKHDRTRCLEMVNREYKFYLSFENSNYHEYITEKLYQNALGFNDLNHLMLPIVMGPPREDYESLVPPASFIHVNDFPSVEDLANYLKKLANDDAMYYSYFRWKKLGRFIDTKFMCRVCSLLHEAHSTTKFKSYDNITEWWWGMESVPAT